MADYNLLSVVLAPAQGAICVGTIVGGAACSKPAGQRVTLACGAHPVCTDHAQKAASWLAAKATEKGARVYCPTHKAYTAVSGAAGPRVVAAGHS